MFNRRRFVTGALGLGVALRVQSSREVYGQTPTSAGQALADSNKALVRRFKESQGTPDEDAVMKEVLAPNYKRLRSGFANLAAHAQGQDIKPPQNNLRSAIPDRQDLIEDMIADGNQVGMLFRITGTHQGDFYGLPPSGKPIEILEVGFFTVIDGKITDSWFMADEAAMVKQAGGVLPPRKDGALRAPAITGQGEAADAVIKRLEAAGTGSPQDRNRIMVVRSKGSAPSPGDRAPDFQQRRAGFQHLRDYGIKTGTAKETITEAIPDRADKIDGVLAEGDKVWMRFKVAGTHGANLYGVPASGKKIEAAEVGIMRIVDGKWKRAWYFGDELGLVLQIGAPQMLKA